ncbi:RNA-directed DNA polymerase [Planomicrobium chinense]|uniref:retron St85 family RNA-directed DNA polymerase n=1 Tax=Planococcus chinensis TaxID=272917 RepID=UPI001CC6C271|nr:retron St85 family RNA-directed DNA polymerase [Planococcus chinensis]MBZ5201568.1 RNA-directed DNA polymerase [Planococcus chinensis]
MGELVFTKVTKDLKTKYPILKDVINFKEKHYQTISIRMKNGKLRTIHNPSKALRYYQRAIVEKFLNEVPIHICCTSYQKGKSLKANVLPHANNMYFLHVDIANFFDHIKFSQVHKLFTDLIEDKYEAKFYAELCTLKGTLPQGAITSPSISNAVNFRMDSRIFGYSKKHNIVYTRYADDITLSSNDFASIQRSLYVVKQILQDEGYQLNTRKVRITKPGIQRKVTGLLINEDQEVRVGRKKYRELRSMIYNYKNNTSVTRKENRALFRKIVGWLSYLNVVDEKTYSLMVMYIKKLYGNTKNPFETMLISKEKI